MRRPPPALLLATLAGALAVSACGQSAGGSSMTATASPAPSAQAARGVKLVRVGSFSSPLYVTAPPGDTHRVFVVEQGGRIRVVRDGRKLAAPFLDVSADITSGGEQGLLSMAFAPDYASSGRFYVYFTDTDGNERVQEFRRSASDPDRADPGTRRQILFQADSESNHNGGQMQFGPDGLLYIGMGDGGGAGDMHGARGNGQNLGTWLGKILRIDPHASGGRAYSVPPSNPFVGLAGALPEIYSYGLRNPWRFSFDRSTGDIAIGDVGQGSYEEVDFRRRGGARGVNFGWRVFEGRHRFASGSAPGAVRPVLEQTHSSGWCSITGGYVVRDRSLPALRGRYVYGDYCKGRLYSARLRSGGASRPRAVGVRKVEGLSSFGEDARGRVYVTSLSGPVYRLASK